MYYVQFDEWMRNAGLILGLRPANERRRYKVTPSLIGLAQTYIIDPENGYLYQHLLSITKFNI